MNEYLITFDGQKFVTKAVGLLEAEDKFCIFMEDETINFTVEELPNGCSEEEAQFF